MYSGLFTQPLKGTRLSSSEVDEPRVCNTE